MRRRRVVAIALVLIGAVFGLLTAVAYSLSDTDWGHERERQILEARLTLALEGRARVKVGRLAGSISGPVVIRDVALTDAKGVVVASAGRLLVDGSLLGLLGGNVELSRVVVEHAFLSIEQGKDGAWNLSKLSPPPRAGAVAGPSRMSIIADSVEVRDSRILLQMPDTQPALPPVVHDFTHVNLALGQTAFATPGRRGGSTAIRHLAVDLSKPPIRLRRASGTLSWWKDSLAFDVPGFQLATSSGSAHGRVGWTKRGHTDLAIDVAADSLALDDVKWVSKILPPKGSGSARLHVRDVPGTRSIAYDVSAMDVRATGSRIGGSLTAITGGRTEIRNLALTLEPLDLALVREVFGDSILKPGWRGTLTGSIRGRGGPLDSLGLDSAAVTFDDGRVRGARSRAVLSGVLNVATTPAQFHDVLVRAEAVDLRTLGAIARGADSLHGVLTGRVQLDGPTRDLRFTDLAMTHVDGDRPRSSFRGEGRLATDPHGTWLDAALTLDSVWLGTLMRDRTLVPLRGALRGSIALRGTADTMAVDARLAAGAGTAHLVGTMLLDSTRTSIHGRGTITAFDPRTLVARRDIPAMRLGGVIDVDVDERGSETDRHVALTLDSTTVLGDSTGRSRLTRGRVRFGMDVAGFHVDTADVRAERWRLEARGRLARRGGEARDSVTFSASIDSLSLLRPLILDSTGAPRIDSLRGRLSVPAGVIMGSFESAALRAEFAGSGLRAVGFRADSFSGRAEVRGLPGKATGLVSFAADSVGTIAFAARHGQLSASLRDGTSATIRGEVVLADSLAARFTAQAARSGDTTAMTIDTVTLALGEHRWRNIGRTAALLARGTVRVDSLVVRSDHGAAVSLAGTASDDGTTRGALHIRALGAEEAAFTGLISPDVSGRLDADVDVSGTRDAPVLRYKASVDSIRTGTRERPSIALDGTYADHRAKFTLRSRSGARDMLRVDGELPLDLAFRQTAKRQLDGALALELTADSVSLAEFESLLPGVTGLRGTLDGHVRVAGTWDAPRGTGSIDVTGGAFDLAERGFTARNISSHVMFAGDTVKVAQLELNDSDSPRDGASVKGVILLAKDDWHVDLRSSARSFRVLDDPRFATIEAGWDVNVTGPLRRPLVEGTVTVPYGVVVIGEQRSVLVLPDSVAEAKSRFGIPEIKELTVTLGSDVRLRSRDANVQLSGEIAMFGPLNNPYIQGEVSATRGTYRVDLAILKRTFRVDSGTVIIDGTKTDPAVLSIWTSYLVRSSDQDIHIGAHLYGTSDQPRLELTSDLGSGVAQSEIISYLVFGRPSFTLDNRDNARMRTATAALVPSLGGVLEGLLGPLLPFFSSLQVTSMTGDDPQQLISNPLDGILNSYAIVGGRQVGTDAFLTLTSGVCRGSRLATTSSSPIWFGVGAEYRPRQKIGAAVSMDPGPTPCSSSRDAYQFGFDLFKDWSFGTAKKKP